MNGNHGDLLKLDTQKSLYPEITTSLNKKKLLCRKLTRSVMRKHYEWEAAIAKASKAGDARKVDDVIFDHLCYMFDIDSKLLDQLEADEVHLLMNKLVVAITRRKIDRTAELLKDVTKEKKDEPEKKIPSRSTSKNLKKRGASGSKKEHSYFQTFRSLSLSTLIIGMNSFGMTLRSKKS